MHAACRRPVLSAHNAHRSPPCYSSTCHDTVKALCGTRPRNLQFRPARSSAICGDVVGPWRTASVSVPDIGRSNSVVVLGIAPHVRAIRGSAPLPVPHVAVTTFDSIRSEICAHASSLALVAGRHRSVGTTGRSVGIPEGDLRRAPTEAAADSRRPDPRGIGGADSPGRVPAAWQPSERPHQRRSRRASHRIRRQHGSRRWTQERRAAPVARRHQPARRLVGDLGDGLVCYRRRSAHHRGAISTPPTDPGIKPHRPRSGRSRHRRSAPVGAWRERS
jgi:hypothetical protein